jgi:probable F420-dependent oxidoreductase
VGSQLKVRIGFALGTQGMALHQFGTLVDDLERLGFDSLWLSDRLTGAAPDPLMALSFAAGRTQRLKLGTSVLVLPGRNPVVLAKELASLDRLSGGRLLPAVGLGANDVREHQGFGVASRERVAWTEEVVPLMRRLWTEDTVDHQGPRFHYQSLSLLPHPVQQPIDIWFGGLAPAALRRIGRLGDGWLPSYITPAEAAAGRKVIEEAAARAGRQIDPEHYGVMIVYAKNTPASASLRPLATRRPGVAPDELLPIGLSAVRSTLEQFIAVGTSKFVLRPLEEPLDWTGELEALQDLVKQMET